MAVARTSFWPRSGKIVVASLPTAWVQPQAWLSSRDLQNSTSKTEPFSLHTLYPISPPLQQTQELKELIICWIKHGLVHSAHWWHQQYCSCMLSEYLIVWVIFDTYVEACSLFYSLTDMVRDIFAGFAPHTEGQHRSPVNMQRKSSLMHQLLLEGLFF